MNGRLRFFLRLSHITVCREEVKVRWVIVHPLKHPFTELMSCHTSIHRHHLVFFYIEIVDLNRRVSPFLEQHTFLEC